MRVDPITFAGPQPSPDGCLPAAHPNAFARDGKRTLVIRNSQREYVFTPA